MPRARAFDEAQVLNQAMMCFWKNGYTATSMKHLESATELKTSSIYNSFGSKDELFLLSLDHYFQQVMARRIHCYLLTSEQPLEGIREFFSDCFVRDTSGPGMGCFMVNTSTELGPHQAAVRERLQQAFKQVGESFHVRGYGADRLRGPELTNCRKVKFVLRMSMLEAEIASPRRLSKPRIAS